MQHPGAARQALFIDNDGGDLTRNYEGTAAWNRGPESYWTFQRGIGNMRLGRLRNVCLFREATVTSIRDTCGANVTDMLCMSDFLADMIDDALRPMSEPLRPESRQRVRLRLTMLLEVVQACRERHG